jgi:hypothetical protein
MSAVCAKRSKLALTIAKQIAREVPLELAGQVFPTHLNVLDGQGIDIILGMSWMKLHQVVLDIAKQLVYLDSSIYGKVALHLPAVFSIKASVHHTVAKNIEEIPMIQEFLDVFQMIYQECLMRQTLSSR